MSEVVVLDGITYTRLHVWAAANNVTIGLARVWAKKGFILGARKILRGLVWAIPLGAKVPERSGSRRPREAESWLPKPAALDRALKLFRKKFISAILDYDRDPSSRARWSKKDVMSMCQWPYPKDWRTLRGVLEEQVGLILLMPGSGIGTKGREAARPWTFTTCPQDREWSVVNAVAHQLGGMKRTAKVTSIAIAPPDEKHALDEGSKTRIDEALEKQEVKLDAVLETLQRVKQNLLDHETMKLLEEYSDYGE